MNLFPAGESKERNKKGVSKMLFAYMVPIILIICFFSAVFIGFHIIAVALLYLFISITFLLPFLLLYTYADE